MPTQRLAMRQLVQAELSKQGFELPAGMAKPPQAASAVTQAMRDTARQSASRAAQTPDQAARESARRVQPRPARPTL